MILHPYTLCIPIVLAFHRMDAQIQFNIENMASGTISAAMSMFMLDKMASGSSVTTIE